MNMPPYSKFDMIKFHYLDSVVAKKTPMPDAINRILKANFWTSTAPMVLLGQFFSALESFWKLFAVDDP